MPSAPDAVITAFNSLDAAQQKEVQERIADIRALATTNGQSEADFYVTQLRRAADEVGAAYADLTADLYREATKLFRARGDQHEPLSRTVKFFGGWTRSKEALTLSGDVTPRRIQARFNERRMSKIWKYTEETLAHWVAKAVEEYGRPPQVAEYDWWRQRELALAKAKGDETLHIPSRNPSASGGARGRRLSERWGTTRRTSTAAWSAAPIQQPANATPRAARRGAADDC